MPLKSDAQRRYMYARHPEIARRWRKKYGPQKGLPERLAVAKKKAARKVAKKARVTA